MRVLISAALCAGLLVVLAGDAHAQVPPIGAPGPLVRPDRAEPEHFERMKARLLRHHEQRIRALHRSADCIRAARDPQALHACLDDERREREEAHRDDFDLRHP